MPYIEHPLDMPGVADSVADLAKCQTRAEWDQAVAQLVFWLATAVGEKERVPVMGVGKAARTDNADLARIIALCVRLSLGQKNPSHRPNGDFQAEIDARYLETIAAHVPTPGDAARIFMRMTGGRLSYTAALKRAARARDRGGFKFAKKGTRFRPTA